MPAPAPVLEAGADQSFEAGGGMTTITSNDFAKVEIRVGKVLEVEDFPEAHNPSWYLQIDFGGQIGVKRSSAAIRNLYPREDLLGRAVVAVVNFPPKQIATRMSEVLVLAAINADGSMRLLQPDGDVEIGARIA
jgi:tRNA-binding protein